MPQLLVRLVHLLGGAHLDAQVLANERKERRGEVHLALLGDGHVHANQLLVGEPVGALVAEAERRVHVAQHVVHLRVVNVPGGIWVVLRPHANVLVQVVGAEDGAVSRQVVKVVHDDGDEQIQHLRVKK